MKARLSLFVALVALATAALVSSGSAAAGGGGFVGPLLCVDRTVQVHFNQYGYYDGRTEDQMEFILRHGDPNGAVIDGQWVQQLPPGEFADYVGPDPYAPGAYVIHNVRYGFCPPILTWKPYH